MPNFAKFYDGDMDSLATVLAFDPGGTTGWCAMSVHPDVLAMGVSDGDEPTGIGERKPLWDTLYHVEYGQIDCDPSDVAGTGVHHGQQGLNMAGENLGVQHMLGLAHKFDLATVVVEDFILDMKRANAGRDLLSPVRITSSFSYALWQLDKCLDLHRQVFVQNRSPVKTTCTDHRLNVWGLYDRNSGDHARDATRHAYYFLRDCRGAEVKAAEKRWRAWPHLFEDPMLTHKPKRARAQGEVI